MNERWVEQYYSNGIYPIISTILRALLGWLPFSFGDILYGMVVIWLLIKGVKLLQFALNKQLFQLDFKSILRRGLIWILLIYISFNVLWGINYNRKGIAVQLGLSVSKYSVTDLIDLNAALLQKVNESNTLLLQTKPVGMKPNQIFDRSKQAYLEAEKQYPFLNYHQPSIKSSLWGWLGNYVGFLGYYNPSTDYSGYKHFLYIKLTIESDDEETILYFFPQKIKEIKHEYKDDLERIAKKLEKMKLVEGYKILSATPVVE